MKRLQHASALEARLDADEKPDGRPEQDETIHRGFEALNNVANIARAHVRADACDDDDRRNDDNRSDDADAQHAKPHVRLSDPECRLLRVARELDELPANTPESRVRKPLGNPAREPLGRCKNATGIELFESGHGRNELRPCSRRNEMAAGGRTGGHEVRVKAGRRDRPDRRPPGAESRGPSGRRIR